MAVIKIQRGSGFADKVRNYKVFINSEEVGIISEGEIKEYNVSPGTHTVSTKIDWAGSKDVIVNLKETDVVNFKVENYTAKHWLISVYFIAFITLVHIVLYITIDFQYTSLLFIPILAIMGYYLPIGRNKYLTLKEL